MVEILNGRGFTMSFTKDNYTITELSKILSVTDHTLRYYEKEFDLPVPRDSRGRRFYTSYLYDVFVKIKELRDEDYDIKSIREFLLDNIENYIPTNLKDPSQDSVNNLNCNIKVDECSHIESQSIEIINSNIDEVKSMLTDLLHKLPADFTTGMNSSTLKIIAELNNCATRTINSIEANNEIVDSKLERHFSKIDDSLSEWRKKSKGGTFKQLFEKIGIMTN